MASSMYVAPPAGAWIETQVCHPKLSLRLVAPPAGAWIETQLTKLHTYELPSLPPRERGLKLK